MPPKKARRNAKVTTKKKSTVVELIDKSAPLGTQVKDAMQRVAFVGSIMLDFVLQKQTPNARGKYGYVPGMADGIFFDGSYDETYQAYTGHYKYANKEKYPARGWSCGYKEDYQLNGSNGFCMWNAYNLSKDNAWGLVPALGASSTAYGDNNVRIANGLEQWWASSSLVHYKSADELYAVSVTPLSSP